jgi:regulator of sigma E protease
VQILAVTLWNTSPGDVLRAIFVGAVVLGFLVLLHEWGHFVAAKLCRVRVDVFSIGFGPRVWGVKRGDTDYRLSALPLGGYVRMAGDNPVEERTGAPYEFLSRPRWQRFIIAVAGPIMNILLTFLLFWGMFAFKGKPVDQADLQPANVVALPAYAPNTSGIQAGDRILEVNGRKTPTWASVFDVLEDAAPGSPISLLVSRGGAQETLKSTMPAPGQLASSITGYPSYGLSFSDIQPGSPAQKAGLKPNDTVVTIDGRTVVTWLQMTEEVQHVGGHPIHFVVRRDGKDLPFTITPVKSMDPATGDSVWAVGVLRDITDAYEPQGFLLALRDAGVDTYVLTRSIGDVVAGLFRGLVSVRDLAGPVGIVQMSGQAAKRGTMTLLRWIAFISLNLGLVNLLPIPIMDGGHVLMLAIEGTLRRDLSLTFKERFVQVGLVFILGLFAFVMYSDILRLIQSH